MSYFTLFYSVFKSSVDFYTYSPLNHSLNVILSQLNFQISREKKFNENLT